MNEQKADPMRTAAVDSLVEAKKVMMPIGGLGFLRPLFHEAMTRTPGLKLVVVPTPLMSAWSELVENGGSTPQVISSITKQIDPEASWLLMTPPVVRHRAGELAQLPLRATCIEMAPIAFWSSPEVRAFAEGLERCIVRGSGQENDPIARIAYVKAWERLGNSNMPRASADPWFEQHFAFAADTRLWDYSSKLEGMPAAGLAPEPAQGIMH